MHSAIYNNTVNVYMKYEHYCVNFKVCIKFETDICANDTNNAVITGSTTALVFQFGARG